MPELRTYALQEANYLHSRIILYAQVTDKEGKLNKVIPVGPMVSFGQPDAKVGKFSDLNILYQNGPRTFNYTVINPDGQVILRQTYDYTSRPRLFPMPMANDRYDGHSPTHRIGPRRTATWHRMRSRLSPALRADRASPLVRRLPA